MIRPKTITRWMVPLTAVASITIPCPARAECPLDIGGVRAFDTASQPTSIASGDLDGDSIADLVVGSRLFGTVRILLGNGDGSLGDGTFRPGGQTTVGDDPARLLLLDLNADDILDIVSADRGDGTLSWRLGTGSAGTWDGGFTAREMIEVGQEPWGLAAIDLDGDGIQDLVTSDAAGALVLVIGGGTGGVWDSTFAVGESIPLTGGPRYLAVGELSGDPHPDLVVARHDADSVAVFTGRGDGSVDGPASFPAGDGPVHPVLRAHGPDVQVIVVCTDGDEVAVLPAPGDGTLDPPTVIAVGSGPTWASVIDTNGDGSSDVVVANTDEHSLSVLEVQSGPVPFGEIQRIYAGDGPGAAVVGPFDAEASPDLVTLFFNSDAVGVFRGTGASGFDVPLSLVVGSQPSAFVPFDIQTNGISDFVVVHESTNRISVFEGGGTVGWDSTLVEVASPLTARNPIDVVVEDFNLDGIFDVAALSRGLSEAWIHHGGDAGGVWDGTLTVVDTVNTGSLPNRIIAADLQTGVSVDLATANLNDQSVSVALPDTIDPGNGLFLNPEEYPTASGPADLVAADFNDDVILDLAVVAGVGAGGVVSYLRGLGTNEEGNGRFAFPIDYPAGFDPSRIATADLDGDGALDLVVTNPPSGMVTLLFGLTDGGSPNGSFSAPTSFPAGPDPTEIAIGDLNGDRTLDIAVTHPDHGRFGVLLGSLGPGPNGSRAFGLGEPTEFLAEAQPRSIALLDVDADGRDEVLIGNWLTGRLVFLENRSLCDGTPVMLQHFSARPGRDDVVLAWRVTADPALSHLRLDRSTDGGPFRPILPHAALGAPGTHRDTGLSPGTTYHYRLTAVPAAAPPFTVGELRVRTQLSEGFALGVDRPVSAGAVTFRFETTGSARVDLVIHDVAGRVARHLVRGSRSAGFHTVAWDGRDEGGRGVASGIYFATLTVEGQRVTRRLVIRR